MEITQVSDATFTPRGSGLPRSEGLHMSDIIRDIYFKMQGQEADRTIDQAARMRMEMGFYWEDVFSRAWADREAQAGTIFRPDEGEKDGIFYSPDGILIPAISTSDFALEEYKCTWTSSSRLVIDNWRWMTQIKGYMHGLGLDLARLRVFYVNGNYKNREPEYAVYEIRAGYEGELQENWDMLVTHAKGKGWI